MFSLSKDTVKIVQEKILPKAEQLNCAVHNLSNGATVVDMGIQAGGSWEAAQLFTEVTLSGMGMVSFGRFKLGNIDLPSVNVHISKPQIACLSSQFSSWKIQADEEYEITGLGSGPARALAQNDHIAALWDYQDMNFETVFAAQMSSIPDEEFAENIAKACKIKPENLYIIAAKTGSIVGSVQICARMIEASMWRLNYDGFDIKKIITASGFAPIAPCVNNELLAMNRVNTAVLYGATASYIVDCEDAEIERILNSLAFSSSKFYGREFSDLFDEGSRDIFKMDIDAHKVACIEINNYRTGRSFKVGNLNEEMLSKAFFN
ncbi:MAG: methenyltetrahydromethanopterin cyclohydrolase [Clostridia bacterium]